MYYQRIFPEMFLGKILQGIYCLEEFCNECIVLQQSYKDCFILQEVCFWTKLARLLQGICCCSTSVLKGHFVNLKYQVQGGLLVFYVAIDGEGGVQLIIS